MQPLDVLCSSDSFWIAQNPSAPLDLSRLAGTKRQTLEWLLQQRCVAAGLLTAALVPLSPSICAVPFATALQTSLSFCRHPWLPSLLLLQVSALDAAAGADQPAPAPPWLLRDAGAVCRGVPVPLPWRGPDGGLGLRCVTGVGCCLS